MKKLLGMSVFLLSLFVLASCGSDDPEPSDETKPVINVTAPAANAEFTVGTDIMLSGTFTDDKELKGVTFTLASTETGAWTPAAHQVALTGVTETLTDEVLFVTIPVDAVTGDYTLTVTLTDAAGNTANKNIAIEIEEVPDAADPTFGSDIKPVDNDPFPYAANVVLSGTFTDDKALSKVVATLTPPAAPAGGSATLKGIKIVYTPWTPDAFEIPLEGMSHTLPDTPLFGEAVPVNSTLGNYTLTLTLHDVSGKTSTKEVIIEITE